MSGIYIHIPFCKQACHYCDFHFSTSLKKKDEMILALAKEIALRKNEAEKETIKTIYFGAGTPRACPSNAAWGLAAFGATWRILKICSCPL